jgi:hypothetical protein
VCLSPIENGTARRRCRFIFGRINRGDGRNAQIAAMIGGGGFRTPPPDGAQKGERAGNEKEQAERAFPACR